jgi:type IV pilus assembly protein PilO
MTYSSDLIESDLVSNTSFIAAPVYPSIFGVTFNPIVSGLCVAVAGIGISGYIYWSYLQPQLTKNQELETKLAQTQDQIQQRKDNATKIAAAEQNLDRANTQKQIVTSLFASDKKLDTFLLDLNKLVNIRQGQLQAFKPDVPPAGAGIIGSATVVSDGSLGKALDNKIKRKGIAIALKGSFEQVQSILRTIERLDQLLLVKDFTAAVIPPKSTILFDNQGKPVPQPTATIATTFKIQALIPMTPAEQVAATPPPAATAVKK